MQITRRIRPKSLGTGILVLLLLANICFAQDKRETLQATAHGQGNQMGMTIGVTVTIESQSTAEDQKALWQAFDTGGKQGLLDALVKMSPRGHFSFSGVAEYEVIYIREFPNPAGRKIRLVARRPVTQGEARGYQTFAAYTLSALEFDLGTGSGKSTGVFLPDCEFSASKEKGIEIEAYQNPWRLDEITQRISK